MRKLYILILSIILVLIARTYLFSQEKFTKWQDKPLIGVLFSPDGKNLASVGSDKTIKIWSVDNGNLINTLYDNVSGEVAISYSPDGKKIVSGSWDKDVKVWDVESGKVISRFVAHDKSLRTVSYHPNGKYIASAGWDKDILVWYEPTGLLLKKLTGHNQCVRAIEYSPCGKFIASGGYDLYLRIHDVASGNIIFQEKGHKYPIEALSYSPDGKYIATGGNDNYLKIWNVNTKSVYKTLIGHTDAVYTVNFSPDGKYLASAGNDNSIKIWDIEKGINIMTFKGHTLTVKSVAFSPNGKLIVSTGADKTIRVWDVSSLNIIPSEKVKSQQKIVTDDLIFKFIEVVDNTEFYYREYELKIKIKNLKFDNIRLFINKKEFVQFNGKDTIVVKPEIKNSDEFGYIDLKYNVYLIPGDNQLQLYADKNSGEDVYVSDIINLSFYDIEKQANISSLHVLNLTPENYSDKKLNKEFVQKNPVSLVNELIKQENIIFKNVKHYDIFSNYENSDTIITRINKFITSVKPYDYVLININGFLVGKNDISIINPNSSSKELSFTKIDSILTLITKKTSYIGMIINQIPISNKINDNLNPSNFDELLIKLSGILNLNQNSFLFISENNTQNPFEIIAKSAINNVDKNKNTTVEINEINNFIKDISNITFYFKGKPIPLFKVN